MDLRLLKTFDNRYQSGDIAANQPQSFFVGYFVFLYASLFTHF
jgi:hypothetical protein